MWSSAAATRHVNCGLPPEFFFVAPASSFQHHHHPDSAAAAAAATTISFDPHTFNASNAIGVGVGVIPLLTTAPCLAQQNILGGGSSDDEALNTARSRGSSGMQLWQHQQGQNSSSAYCSKKPMILDHTNLLHSGAGGGATCGIGGSSSSVGATTCQDCGNQAKKDCVHRRCRTCCKSRGYDCLTHVKSTWVSASRRRDRQVARESLVAAGSSQSTSGAKKPRLAGASQTTTTASHTSTSNTTPPRSFDTSSSHQDASFKDSLPGQVRAPAVFKCVRVTAVDDGEDEYAYQAVVKIGGHVFKGFLYDQGVEERDNNVSFPNISELHLGGGGAGRSGASSTQAVLDPTDIIAAPGGGGGGFLGGTSYGNPMN